MFSICSDSTASLGRGSRLMFDIVDKGYLKGVHAPPVLVLAARVGPLTSFTWARSSDSGNQVSVADQFPGRTVPLDSLRLYASAV